MESKSSFAHVWHILLWLSDAHHILFLLKYFTSDTDFPSQFYVFLTQNHQALLKDQDGISRKWFWKEQKPVAFFFVKL